MKRTQIKRRPLADSVLQSLEPEAQDYREKDSTGLYLLVKSSGKKSWNLRYKRPNGKWAWKGLGGFPAVSGKLARARAQELLVLASNGVDLTTMDQVAQHGFKDAAENWYQRKLDVGRASGTTRQMRMYLDSDVYPVLGKKNLDEITRADCMKVQQRLEERGAHNIAKKVRSWLNQIFSLAIAEGKCELNPASELRHVAAPAPKTQHYPHLLEPELPEFLCALKNSPSRWVTLTLVKLVLRTASRPHMARYAEWDEIDLSNALWTVPAEKMKMRRDHLVPLASQTVAELRELFQVTGRQRYLFPGSGSVNPVMSENTINKSLSLIGYKGKLVGHGSRHTASTLLREHGWHKDFVESQLAHVEGGTAGIYNRAQYLEQRRAMMQWYADYLDALEQGTERPADPSRAVF